MASDKPAVVLLSGGMDSATTLAVAKSEGYRCYALTFNYQQRHSVELAAAKEVAQHLGAIHHKIIDLDLRSIGGSALTDDIAVPKTGTESATIPPTYVPARNLIFLSIALAYAETLRAEDIFIGVNIVDYSGYPDCRPEFIRGFEELAKSATRAGSQGSSLHVHAPLMNWDKPKIILTGEELGVDFSLTHSCYDPNSEGLPCGECDACRIRAEAFRRLGRTDPVLSRQ